MHYDIHAPPPQGTNKRRTWIWLSIMFIGAVVSSVLASIIAAALSLDILFGSAVLQALLLCTVLFVTRMDRVGMEKLQLRLRWEKGDTRAALLLVAVQYGGSLITAIFLAGSIDTVDLEASALTQAFTHFSPWEFLLVATGVTVLVAFTEEILFRGYLISRLEAGGLPVAGAVVVSAALFGLVHWSGYGWILSVSKAVTFGIPAAIYFVRRRKLFPIIVAHTFVNFFGFVIAYLAGSIEQTLAL